MSINQIKDRVTLKLESESCPVHGQRPKISWSGDSFTVECCCDAFKKHLSELAKSVISKEVSSDILSRLQQ